MVYYQNASNSNLALIDLIDFDTTKLSPATEDNQYMSRHVASSPITTNSNNRIVGDPPLFNGDPSKLSIFISREFQQYFTNETSEVKTNEFKLSILRQGKNPVSHYASKFHNIASRTKLDRRTLLRLFRGGLSEKTREILDSFYRENKLSIDFWTYVNQATELDQGQRDLEAHCCSCSAQAQAHDHPGSSDFALSCPIQCESPSLSLSQEKTFDQQKSSDQEKQSNRENALNQEKQSDQENSFNQETNMMNLGTISQVNNRNALSPLTKAERDRRLKLRVCLYCAGDGHVLQNCPVRPDRRSRR
ncbi:MAG: hypothetical protein EXX96DRAFT_614174 [Benjaminiella poitrasii]|nr:MAG: hypothetical protein EXX96DRAFT_614174 [Benjaminiella poitrasii]